MCGLLGVYFKEKENNLQYEPSIRMMFEDMLGTLRLRGPDERTLLQIGSVFLGHTRLSIIDLQTGTQPILNEDRTVAVILNGEIYNFLELKQQLMSKGHAFSTQSDTEVIVHLYEEVGDQVFAMLNGMFAIIIYDLKSNALIAARDRMGEKPLLYCDMGNRILFASEIKAILKDSDVQRNLNLTALALYLNSIAIPAPITIFQGISKLKPAHYIKVQGAKCDIRRYWNPRIMVDWHLDEEEIHQEFTNLFSDSVKRRIVSDVPIGVFLSGGIDSSAVVAFMAQHCSEVRSFSVGFADEIDERPYARMVAERYGTKHTELFLDQKIEDVVLEVLQYFDEPFGDSSAIPTHMISREARKHVKVILTGDGGDELFAGYDAYLNQKYQLWGRLSTKAFKMANRLALQFLGRGVLERYYPMKSGKNAYDHWLWVRAFNTEDEIRRMLDVPEGFLKAFYIENQWLDFVDRDALSLSYWHDINYYLPDDLLKKVDMASMLTSLECRTPFLDHRIVELSLKIPPHLKVKDDVLKHVLKRSLQSYLPEAVLYRTKTGFGAPVESWMKNQLRDLVNDYLSPGCSIERIIPRKAIKKAKNDVYSLPAGSSDYRVAYRLWLLFVLEVWMRTYY